MSSKRKISLREVNSVPAQTWCRLCCFRRRGVPGAMQHAASLRRDASQNRDPFFFRVQAWAPALQRTRPQEAARCAASGARTHGTAIALFAGEGEQHETIRSHGKASRHQAREGMELE